MIRRNVSAKIVGGVVVIGAAIASCSFPTYNITVTGGSGGATSAASTTSTAMGGAGGASTTSSASVGGAGGATATASSGSGSGGDPTTGTTSGTGTTASSSTGPCPTDTDGDTYTSAACPGGDDCADGDVLANPAGTFHAFPVKNPLPGTPAYDFNCNGKEEYEINAKLDCTAIPCNTSAVSWIGSVPACGVSGQYGVCKLGIASCTEMIQGSQQQKCK